MNFFWDDKERGKSFIKTFLIGRLLNGQSSVILVYQTGPVDEKMQPKEPGFINGGSSKRDPEMPYPMFYVDVSDIDGLLK